MPWLHLQKDILEDLVEEHHRIDRREATEERGLEALRRGWRARQAARGLCQRCTAPTVVGRKVCAQHLAANRERALRWHRENRERSLANMKAARERRTA
jgi:hypothetical protein